MESIEETAQSPPQTSHHGFEPPGQHPSEAAAFGGDSELRGHPAHRDEFSGFGQGFEREPSHNGTNMIGNHWT